MKDLKKHAVVTKFPTNKSQKLKFRVPNFIQSTPLLVYIIKTHNVSHSEAMFIIDNMLGCKAVQPGDSYITIGSGDDIPVTVYDVDYGEFRIIGKRKIQCHDPKDLNNTLTSYICSRGITVFVYRYKLGGQLVTSVYYGDKFDGLSSYMKLNMSTAVYEAYIQACMANINSLNEGEYHETYRRSR